MDYPTKQLNGEFSHSKPEASPDTDRPFFYAFGIFTLKLSKSSQPSLNILLGYLLNGQDAIRGGKKKSI